MKAILAVYLIIHLFCGGYLYHELEWKVVTHFMFALPGIILYAVSCYKNV